MKKLLFGLGLLMPFLLSAQQVARSLTASNGTFIGFYEYKPPTYSSGAKSPMIIFLHGIGERGDGSSTLSSVLNVGIPRNINYGLTNMVFNYNGSQQGFVVLSPQLSYNYGNWQPFYIQEMIKYAKANLNVDTNRIYLTGLSLGGGGVWNYASSSAAAAKGLAAIAPICGTCDWSGLNNIAQQALPVWAFHAMDDGVVGVGCTQAAISGILAYAPSVIPQATYYPTGNHWIWDQVYDPANPQLYLWFLSKSRGGSAAPPPSGGANVAPVANAGSAQTITLPSNSVSLTGSASYDQDGTITNYAWSQVSGPGTASFVNAAAANTSVGGLLQGTYVFKLTVTDNGGLTNSSTVTITVNPQAAPANLPPVAAVSANQTITLPTNSAFLLGSGSYDPGGGWITNYAWTQESGPSTATTTVISNTNLDVKNLVAGTYVFKLTVTDNQGATNSATTQVTVNGTTPVVTVVANAGSNQTLTLPTNTATLNGSASTGANSYAWTETSGPTQATINGWNTVTPTVTNMVAGTYAFKLTVSNTSGASSSAEVQVVVNGGSATGSQPPVANAGSNQSLTLPTNSTYLYGSGSYAPGGGTITNYQWTQQSGPSSATITAISTTNVEVKNMIAGTYVFKLTVTDAQGGTNAATVQVVVTGTTPPPSGGNTPPVANAGSNQTITLPTNTVSLIGSGSYDPGGWIVDYTWEQQSGPSAATISMLSESNAQAKNLVAGTYVFKLTVEDNQGAMTSATVTITVNGSAALSNNTPPVAVAGSTQWITLPTNAVYLMGSGSYDPGGWITNYAWSQVSGPNTATLTTISSTNVEAKNLVAGTYTFRLTVTDNGGATNSATMQVVVNGGARTASTTTDPTIVTSAVNTSTTSTSSLTSNTVATSGTTTDKAASTNSLVLYPNPVSTTMTVQVSNSITGNLQISILTTSGIAVKTIKATKSSFQFTQQVNMQDVAQGTYVVEIKFADGTRVTNQVVKQ